MSDQTNGHVDMVYVTMPAEVRKDGYTSVHDKANARDTMYGPTTLVLAFPADEYEQLINILRG